MVTTRAGNSSNNAWAGNVPQAVFSSSKRLKSMPSNTTNHKKWLPSPEFSKWIEEHSPKPFQHTLPPRSGMVHGVRVDFKQFELYYLEILKNLPYTFTTAVKIHPVPQNGYIDMGFATAENADEVAKINYTYNNLRVPLIRTRHNKETLVYLNIFGLPTTINAATTKVELEKGLGNYGDIKSIQYEENEFIPGFIGRKAFVTFSKLHTPPSEIYSSRIPCKVFLPSARTEIFNIVVEGRKVINDVPVQIGQFHPNYSTYISPITQNSKTKNSEKDLDENTIDPEEISARMENDAIVPPDEESDSDEIMEDNGIMGPLEKEIPIFTENHWDNEDMEGDEVYISEDHRYPIFSKSVANEQRYEIYQLRETVFDHIANILGIKDKINKHVEKFDPPKKNILSRYSNQIDEEIEYAKEDMDIYWKLLQEHVPLGDAADPEILNLVKLHISP